MNQISKYILIILLSCCLFACDKKTGTSPIVTPETPKDTTLDIGDTVYNFVKTDMNGETFRMSEHRGKVMMFTFYGKWFSPFFDYLPNWNRIADKYQSKPFELVAVSRDYDYTDFKNIALNYKFNFVQVFDGLALDEFSIYNNYQVKNMNWIYLVDKRGRLAGIYPQRFANLELQIDSLILVN